MEVAVLVHGYRLAATGADDSLRLILEVNSDTSVFSLYIYEGNVVLRKHRMCYTTNLNLDLALIKHSNYRNMLLHTCVNGIGNQFFHLFAAAHNRDLTVNHLFDDIAAMTASIKFYSHNMNSLIVYTLFFLCIAKISIKFEFATLI